MRRSTTFKVLSVLFMVFMVFNFAQAQFPPNPFTAINIVVTTGADDTPVADYPMWLGKVGETTMLPIMTDENGTYTATVLKNDTYIIKSMNDAFYQAFEDTVKVDTSAVEHAIHLEKRTDLVEVTGNVSFEGNGVATALYFQMLSDSVDINDFREYESHFAIPGMLLQWATYNTESGADGNFTLEMVDGKYVVYIPAGETTLAHWGVFEVKGATALDPIVLQKMSTLSGHVDGTDGYENIMIFAYSLNAGRPAMAIVDDNGDYTMDVAPGEYVVRCQAFFDDYMYAVFYDSVYSAEEAIKVNVDEDGGTADFVLPAAEVFDFSISGTITSNDSSGRPLEGANVMFASYNFFSNLYKTYEATTDADGKYTVAGKTIMQEDSLVGFAWKDSTFFAQFYDGQATFLNADPIVYHAGEDVTGIDFALDSIDTENNFSISGMVKDEDGNPVTTGQVTAYTTATNVGVITALIDTLGNYAFDSAFPSGSTVYLQAWGGFGYLPSIYDGAESWEDADAIEITDHDVDNINFTLEKVGPARVPLGSISGLVDLGGGNLAKASATSAYEGDVVYVKPVDADEWTGYDYVDENGNFELPIEKDGDYDVLLSTRDNGDVESQITVSGLEGEIKMTPTGIKDAPTGIITSARLHDAYPNPFNPTTTIQVDMAKTAQASLTIYNVLGQKVKVLYNGKLDQGSRKFNWNGVSASGRQVASGLYFYQLKTGNTVQTKAVMFIK